jgi:four helix bundle protein
MMAEISNFEDIIAWQKAREQANQILDLVEDGPISRLYPLRNQLTGAALSVMNNISEGFERDSDREFIRFLAIAKGSCGEVRSMLHLIHDRNYISDDKHSLLVRNSHETSRMISGLIRYLKSPEYEGKVYKNDL